MVSQEQLWGDLRSVLASKRLQTFDRKMAYVRDDLYLGDALILVLREADEDNFKAMREYVLSTRWLTSSFKGEFLLRASMLRLQIKAHHLHWVPFSQIGHLRPWEKNLPGNPSEVVTTSLFNMVLYAAPIISGGSVYRGRLGEASVVEEGLDALLTELIREYHAHRTDLPHRYFIEGFNAWLSAGKDAAFYGIPTKDSYAHLGGWEDLGWVKGMEGALPFNLGETMAELNCGRHMTTLTLNGTRFLLGLPEDGPDPPPHSWEKMLTVIEQLQEAAVATPHKLLLDGNALLERDLLRKLSQEIKEG